MRWGIAGELAEWAAGLAPVEMPETAMEAARRLWIDRLGISLGGRRLLGSHATARLAAKMAGLPAATLWGSGSPSFAPYAALANRASGDALELAAGPEIVEAGFAAGEAAERTLEDLLVSLAVAAEVDGYIRRWLGASVERHGLHPPALLGAIPAAVAAGRLLGLGPVELAGAIASAATLAPQSPFAAFSAGASGKTLYGAWAQMLGLWACHWATRGVVGGGSAIEGYRGIAQALLDARDAVSPPPFLPAEGGWAIEKVSFKPFPCCRACHPALTALSRLGALDARRIQSVQVRTYPYAVELDASSRGDGPIATQVSIRKTVALFLVQGELTPGRSYCATGLADPAVVDLARRVHVEADPELAGSPERRRGARVRVTLSDGTQLEEATEEPLWGPSRPATTRELLDRYDELAAPGQTGWPAAPALWSLPGSTSLPSLAERWTSPGG